jgi:cell division protein FtsB
MVVRKRLRAIVIPIAFYLVLGGASLFLVWAASKGDRGLVAKAVYEAQTAELRQELDGLRQERERWQRRVEAMRSESVDRDLVEEEAHTRLDRAYKDEVVIFLDKK